MTGQRFGRLVVLKQADDYIEPKSGQHKACWWCQCDCGSDPFVVLQNNLKRQNGTKSCGCINREQASTIHKYSDVHKTNNYDLSNDYGIGWTTNTNREFYFDLEDYDKIKDYCWSETVNTKGYHSLVARDSILKKNVTMFHILVGKHYDHINRNPLDNRKENLRPATIQENNINRSIQSNNTSGFIGVYFDKHCNKWIAQIKKNRKNIHLGVFQNKEEAIYARLQAELKYFGPEFSPQRHLFKEYGVL